MRRFFALLLISAMLAGCFACTAKKAPEASLPLDDSQVKQEETDTETESPIVIRKGFFPQYEPTDEYDGMKGKLKKWFTEALEGGELFSANVGGKAADFKAMEKDVRYESSDGNETVTARFFDSATGLEYVLTGVLYGHSPSLDYVIRITNTSDKVSPLISELYAIDSAFPLKPDKGYVVNTNKGSNASADDFAPIKTTLARASEPTLFASMGGASSDTSAFPFFDVLGKGEGLIMAIGWSGQWEAGFTNDKVGSVTLTARQQIFDSVLLPKESIRTPSIVLTYFEGDSEYGHNVWRKLVVSDYLPPSDDEEGFVAPLSLSTWGGTKASSLEYHLDLWDWEEMDADIFWVDAGWYSQGGAPAEEHGIVMSGEGEDSWNRYLGNWTENKALFPRGMKALVGYVHENSDLKFMLWWMIEDARGPVGDDITFGIESYYQTEYADGSRFYAQSLRLDDEKIADKLIDYFSYYIEEVGIDCIRLDKSATLDWTWSVHDERRCSTEGVDDGERRGITEAHYIENFYRVWDTLYEKYPQFMLDNCSSGGRRIDIEMTKRAIPLWRTDYTESLEATQAMTQHLSAWLPLHGIGNANGTAYGYRSYYSASTVTSIQNSKDAQKRENTVKIFDEFAMLRPYWYGSYYQLIEANNTDKGWQAYELYREDMQEGMLVVIKRPAASVGAQKIKLKGLMEEREYTLHNIDDATSENDIVMTGKELMEKGISVNLPSMDIDCFKISLNLIDSDIVK